MDNLILIDQELFTELKGMMSSSNEEDVIMAISILETSDPWNKQNMIYKEELYETLRENKHVKNKSELKMKVWLASNFNLD